MRKAADGGARGHNRPGTGVQPDLIPWLGELEPCITPATVPEGHQPHYLGMFGARQTYLYPGTCSLRNKLPLHDGHPLEMTDWRAHICTASANCVVARKILHCPCRLPSAAHQRFGPPTSRRRTKAKRTRFPNFCKCIGASAGRPGGPTRFPSSPCIPMSTDWSAGVGFSIGCPFWISGE